MDNYCVCCGEIIPEGRQVCWRCEHGSDNIIQAEKGPKED